MSKKRIMGIVTISLIIGGTIYCIKKYKDDMKYGEPIDLEEARDIVKRHSEEAKRSTEEVAKEFGMTSEEIEEMVDEARDEVNWNMSFQKSEDDDEDVDHAHEYDFYDGLDWNRPLSEYITEEDKTLRYEANTVQARDQFIKMELADLTPGMQEYQIMKRLYDFPFEPLNDGDSTLYSQLSDYREEFFGPDSRWNDNVSFADIIAHFARATDYNIGGGVGTWIVKFVRFIDITELDSGLSIGDALNKLNQHTYQNDRLDTYGLFGLEFDDCVAAEEMAELTIDGQLTYEIEYNTFLKSVM